MRKRIRVSLMTMSLLTSLTAAHARPLSSAGALFSFDFHGRGGAASGQRS
ncbi:MAG TPA: hypothetical protein VF654_18435 [Pyrinomonadaceae bacterium]